MAKKRRIGVICECNPFHAGHEYLLRRAKEQGDAALICVMSGCFVQRGEAAIANRYLRAEALVAGGADLVVELPFPYAASGAEFFARAGVEILDRMGVEELWFGSECGDLDRLLRAAEICDSPEFARQYAESTTERCGTAEAYFSVLSRLLGEGESLASNDILGIAYLRAIRARKSKMRAVTVKREGSGYREESIEAHRYPSATALRKIWLESGRDSLLPHLPDAVREIYAKAEEAYDLRYAERLILGYFRLTPPQQIEQIAELGGGLGNRLSQAAVQAQSLEELLSLAATKKYPTARLRRGILFALTHVTSEDLRRSVAYVRLLAADAVGRELLACERKSMDLPVVTRRTDLPNTPEALRQELLESRAWALCSLCRPTVGVSDTLWKIAPRMR